jgi:hypothetical protein
MWDLQGESLSSLSVVQALPHCRDALNMTSNDITLYIYCLYRY